MKKDSLPSLAAIEAAPQRSGGIADSAVQKLSKDLLLMLLKKKLHYYFVLWLVGTPTIKNKKTQPPK